MLRFCRSSSHALRLVPAKALCWVLMLFVSCLDVYLPSSKPASYIDAAPFLPFASTRATMVFTASSGSWPARVSLLNTSGMFVKLCLVSW